MDNLRALYDSAIKDRSELKKRALVAENKNVSLFNEVQMLKNSLAAAQKDLQASCEFIKKQSAAFETARVENSKLLTQKIFDNSGQKLLESHGFKDFVELLAAYQSAQSKLAELEKQEPAIRIVNGKLDDYNPNYEGSLDGDFYAEPKPSAPARRITEQDAREIGANFYYAHIKPSDEKTVLEVSQMLSVWLASSAGKFLLAKLNEHREAEIEQEHVATVDHSDDDVTGGEWFAVFKPDIDLKLGQKLYVEPVTANKAEVPEGYCIVKEGLVEEAYKEGFGDVKSYNDSVLNDPNIEWLNSQAKYDLDHSLPPLKDGEL